MNEGLFSAYTALPSWKELISKLQTERCLSVSGMAEGEKPFFAAALAHRTGRPVLLLSPTELIAQKQSQDINRLVGSGAAMLPTRDIQFSRAAASQESTWQRLQVLSEAADGRLRVLCASAEGVLDRCCPIQRFQAATIHLSEGGAYAPLVLLEKLVRGGYERVPMVEGKGQCAMRGAILDVYPPSEPDALRIEFFGDEVDSIRRFDCISQRSIARIKDVRLCPATECIPEDANAAANRLEAALRANPTVLPSQAGANSAAASGDIETIDAFLAEIDLLDAQADEAAKEFAATAMIDLAAKNSRGVPTLPKKRTPETAQLVEERETQLKHHLEDVARVRDGHLIRTAPMWMNVLCLRLMFLRM
ncbi:MAG: hypothetical protein EOM69_11695 [Clostridia bacterium]|nr:hypothetical protein [Clostridia bacterium]